MLWLFPAVDRFQVATVGDLDSVGGAPALDGGTEPVALEVDHGESQLQKRRRPAPDRPLALEHAHRTGRVGRRGLEQIS